MPHLGLPPSAALPGALVGSRTPFTIQDLAGTVVYTMPVAGWPVQIGAQVHKGNIGQPTLSFWAMLYDASSGVPGALLNYNSVFLGIPSLSMTNQQTTALANKNLLPAGAKYALGMMVANISQQFFLGFIDQATLYTHTFVAAPGAWASPPNPFAVSSQAASGRVYSIWLEYIENRPPNVPTNVAVNGSTTPGVESLTLTPTFAFRFSDPDQTAGYNEKVSAYEFRVTDTDSGLVIWPLAGQPNAAFSNATTAEQVANVTISRQYPGATAGSSALVSGGNYTVESRTRDLAGEWGDYTAPFAFSIADIGGVDVSNGTPFGKIDLVTDDIAYTARWHHPDNDATSHVQVEVLQNGSQYQLGDEVVKIMASAALPGNPFTISAAESGIDPLPRGETFTYRVRARANGVWTDWSPQREFWTNAPPPTPQALSPVNGATVAAPPLLSWLTSDPDEDDIMGVDVVWTLVLTRPSPLSTLTFQHPTDLMSFDDDDNLASFQLTTTHCPNAGTYVWTVQADDLSASAIEADYGKSSVSDPAQFTLTAGPQPTLTLPATTVNTVTPLIRFTVANGPHTAYQMVIYRAGTLTRVWDSQRVNSGVFDVIPPPGYLANGIAYDAEVTVWSASEAQGTSARRRFTVAFTQPDAIQNLNYLPYLATRDTEPTVVQLTWSGTNLPGSEFLGYQVRRFRTNGEIIVFPPITNRAQTTFWDFHAPPNEPMTYTVSQLRRAGTSPGNQVVEGPQTEIVVTLELGVIVIATTKNPSAERFVLTYLPASITERPKQNVVPYTTWGSDNIPTMISTPGTQEVVQITGILITDQFATRQAQAAAVREIQKAQSIVSVRYNDGRFFGKITDFQRQVGTAFDPDTVTFTVEQTNYQEGR